MGNALLLAAVKDRQAVVLDDAILPFDNLRLHEIEAFWRAFYDSATSFALSKSQLRSICCRAVAFGVSSLNNSNARVAEYADSAFDLFTDSLMQSRWQQVHPGTRGLQSQQYQSPSDSLAAIDALEFLSAIAFIAAVPLDEKIDLLFDSWDMSEDGALDLDEFTISLKSTLSGLAKILQPTASSRATSVDTTADEEEIIMLAESTFREIANCGASSSKEKEFEESTTITCEQFREFCIKNKRAKELFDLFDVADSSPEKRGITLGEEGMPLELVAKLEKLSEPTESSAVVDTSMDAMQDDVGDMFLAVKPWIGAIVAPTKIPPLTKGAPLVSIKLDWIFGYSAQDCKNNARFAATTASAKGGRFEEIVYPAAAACVVLNTKTMKQRHHLSHTDDVLSLSLHPRLPLAASGEIGKQPKIIVWNLETMEDQCILQGFHKRGILQLAFLSPEMLVSIGGDDDHSIAIYESSSNWKSAVLKTSVKGNKAAPFHTTMNPRMPSEFVTCGQKYVEFWSLEGKELVSKKGLLGKKGSLQPFPVAQYLETTDQALVVGTSDGCLYLFVGRQLTNVIKAHEGAITALFYSPGLLLSGGRDGQIIQWDDKLKQVGPPIQIQESLESSLLPQRKGIRSCCYSPDRRTILVGTLASEIYELDAKAGQNIHSEPLTKGHFQGELWGLDTHPTKQQCCTVGDDQTLRIWDLAEKYELGFLELPIPGRACAYSGDGKLIAVGLGTEDSGKAGSGSQAKPTANAKKRQPNGGFVVYSAIDLTCAKEPCFDAKRWVIDVKFSPDNRTLAVASHDSKIYLYNVLKGFSRTHVFNKHSSYITHMDFSLDGNYLQSTSGGYELLFAEVKTGKHITNATTFRDEIWHTMTCTLGWSVQGIWEAESDGTDVNAVDRSNNGKFLATGDDFGKLKVFQYPCALEKASSLELRGHASHVTNVRWSPDDSYIVSVGGNDRCVFVWKHDKQPAQRDNFTRRLSETDSDSDGIDDLDKRADDPLEVAAMNDNIGDEFMAVRPWLGAVVAPSKAVSMKVDSSSPNTRLELERVHGYQAQTASNNARYDSNGRVVYHTAALGITFDKAAQRQSFFRSHDDDVVALCAHPNGTTFATSQMGKKPKIYVWDSASGEAVAPCLEGFHQRFVNAICFSCDGTKLGSVGGDDDHSIAIYNWQSGVLSSQSRGERNNVRGICYHAATKEWVTSGDKHIRFWTEQGKNLTSKKAIFGTQMHKNGKVPSVFDCVVSFGQMVVAGGSTGHLVVFQSSVDVTKTVQGHGSAVLALYATEKELISGGKDSKIAVWDAQFNKVAAFDMKEHTLQGIKLLNSEIRISVGGNDRSIMEWRVLSEGEQIPVGPRPEKRLSLMEPEDATDSSAESEEEPFDDSAGDEFMAVKPWIGAIVAPTNAATPNSREPDLNVELEWVYGYQSELSQQNLVYNALDEIVYHTAAVGIIYDSTNHLQRHHIGHNDDIISFALCDAKRNLIATGERGKKPALRVWDAHTGELRCEMKEFHSRGILSLAFSSDSTRLVSVGDDDDHSLAVWGDASNGSWTLAKLLATGKGDKAVNRFASFGASADTIITGGVKHVLFWSVQGKTIVSKKGIVGKKGTLQTFPTGCNFGGDFVTGTAGGELYVWRGNDLSRTVKAHDGDVRVVANGRVVMWNSAYQSLKCFDLGAMNVGSFGRGINSVFLNSTGRKLLVGTCCSDIIEIDVASGGVLNGGQPLFSGHFAMELWGLAVHPSQREFVTVGDDRTLRVWDMEAKRLIQARLLPAKARACAYSPDSELLAVGFGGDNGIRQRRKPASKQGQAQSREGGFAVLRARDLDTEALAFEDKPAKEWISDVKFSPSGDILALGSHDNSIYLYSVGSGASEFKKRKPFSKHNSYITHFDFSDDSNYIQSNCGAYEYLFCDTASSSQVSRASSVRDVKWATWTCTLGWPVQGIWPDCADGTDINAVCASSSRTVLASGDDSGNVKFFRYPCIPKGSKFIVRRGHSSHVANVRFSFDDKYLISVGGNDRSIFQWKLA
ncbi:Echinoderm microtubule-associated protein-like 6 [Phytophthora cactorum]|nr:Echinoderm microtubule-associated protein-like 6 [Phytophthora cactorum]